MDSLTAASKKVAGSSFFSTFKQNNFMSTQSTHNPSRALEGIHGVHVVPRSPFASEEIIQDERFPKSSCGGSAFGVNYMLMQ